MDMYVSVHLKMPSKHAHHITKQAISKKECVLMAAWWDKARVVCKECMYSKKGL